MSNLSFNNQLMQIHSITSVSLSTMHLWFYPKKLIKVHFFEKSILQLPRVDKVTLAASSKYPGFHLTENWVDVETEITLTSDCSAKTKQEMIIDSMRKQFKKD